LELREHTLPSLFALPLVLEQPLKDSSISSLGSNKRGRRKWKPNLKSRDRTESNAKLPKGHQKNRSDWRYSQWLRRRKKLDCRGKDGWKRRSDHFDFERGKFDGITRKSKVRNLLFTREEIWWRTLKVRNGNHSGGKSSLKEVHKKTDGKAIVFLEGEKMLFRKSLEDSSECPTFYSKEGKKQNDHQEYF
jgi:hypothetical protein